MRIGVALPQYDYSVAGERPLRFETIVEYARLAEAGGADSVWLSDHLFLDLAKYGGSDRREGCFDPIVTLAALARRAPRSARHARAARGAAAGDVLAKALASRPREWRPARRRAGCGLVRARVRRARHGDAAARRAARPSRRRARGRQGAFGGGPCRRTRANTIGRRTRSTDRAVQQPATAPFVGKGDRLLRLAAEHADGWNTCWVWTPDAYRERLRVLDDACASVGRDPATMWRTLGLYALCGEDERDLERRFDRLREQSPPGVLDGVDLATFRVGRLVGTVDEVRAQVRIWEELVSTHWSSASARCRFRSPRPTTSSCCCTPATTGRESARRAPDQLAAAAQDAPALALGRRPTHRARCG